MHFPTETQVKGEESLEEESPQGIQVGKSPVEVGRIVTPMPREWRHNLEEHI